MSLKFTKMHGLGNDFVVLDARNTPLPLDAARIGAMADRHTGIGFDQLLIVEATPDPTCIAAYSIRNADGSAAKQCGNGARCIGAWLHRDGALAIGKQARLLSPAGVIGMQLADATTVTVEMGEPIFEPARIPFEAPAKAASYPFEVAGHHLEISAVSMGNPHAVVRTPNIDATLVEQLGPAISAHPRFADGANAGFVQIVDRANIRLRVHERGAGWTLACGSGACAAVAALHVTDEVADTVRVQLPGGTLDIAWQGVGHPLWMTGPAAFAYDGEWLGL